MKKRRDFKVSVRFTNATKNISRYFSEVTKEKMLDPEEEARLGFLAKNGDMEARDQIIKSNLRFAVSVAKFYAGTTCPLEDLICEANKGLVEAMENFDPTSGFKFISYAVWHVRKNILTFIGNHSKTVRVPLNVSKDIRNFQKAESYFISQNGREPTIEEALETMEKIGLEKINNSSINSIKNNPISIQLDPIVYSSDEDTKPQLISLLSSEEKSDILIDKEDLKKITNSLFKVLTEREIKLITLKYGLESGEEMSNQQLAEIFDRTPEWVRQNLKLIEKKLRVAARKKKIDNIF